MDKVWLKSYPAGVPAEIDVNQYASVREVLEESCAKYGSRRAYSCMGKAITFTELDDLSATFGAFLQARGLAKGARVALMMPNVLNIRFASSARCVPAARSSIPIRSTPRANSSIS